MDDLNIIIPQSGTQNQPSAEQSSTPTIRTVGEVKPVVTERITRAELERRQEQDKAAPAATQQQSTRDINDALNELRSTIPGVHKTGTKSLGAPCPKCSAEKRGSDRFWSSSRTNYNYWQCRGCGHKTWIGQIQGSKVIQNPTVKAWGIQPHDETKIDWVRSTYASLAEFAQIHLDRAMPYLSERGVTEEVARGQGLGYINGAGYLEWYRGLTPELKAGAKFGGLPEPKECGTKLGAGWAMVSGYKGNVVYPYRDEAGNVCEIRTRSISDRDTAYGEPVRYMGPRGGYDERKAHLPYMPVGANVGPVILSEGEFKMLVPLSYGCLYPVYSLRGTQDPIAEMLQYFYGRTVILAFDNDANQAGAIATVNQGRKLRAKGIDVLILDPRHLGPGRAIDDFINDEGIDAFNNLLTPANLLTLPEYEKTLDPTQLENLRNPKADIGTVRRWTPADHVDTFAHPIIENAVSPDEATDGLKAKVKDHIQNFQTGQGQLFSSLPAGTGKTTATMQAVQQVIETEHGTISVFLPNHDQIKEKIEDGTLEGFQEIYGRKWDKNEGGVRNCHQADTASELTRLGYDVSTTICPSCEHLNWCRREGYKSQFVGKANRAYVHPHIFTNYPDGSDAAIIDEATHATFIQDTQIYGGHLQRALAEGLTDGAERELLESLLMLFTVPNIETLQGIEFYTVLQRFYPELIASIDQWGDGLGVQGALFDMVMNCTQSEERNVYEVEQLPPAFAQALFSVLNEDVRRLAQGQQVTGRIKMVNAGSHRYIEIVSSRELPGWYYKTPTVLLNATANETVTKELFGVEGQLKTYSPNVAIQEGNTILQDVTINNAKSGLLGSGEVAQSQRAAWIERIRDHIGNHAQDDAVLITCKPLAAYLADAFPLAKIAWYRSLEGRNDLQAGLTILCNPPAINLPAIQDEARALCPGIDCTLERKSTCYDEIINDENQHLAIEQIDAVDPRLSALIDQHRDALTVQAIGRARLVRNSGRQVVVMFARPIPGHAPTQTIYTREQKQEHRTNKTIEKLVTAAAGLLESHSSFSVSTLAKAAGSTRRTVHKYWQDIIDNLGVGWQNLPAIQQLNDGAIRSVTVRMAVNAEGQRVLQSYVETLAKTRDDKAQKGEITVWSSPYYIYNIGNQPHGDLSIPENLLLDINKLIPPSLPEVEAAGELQNVVAESEAQPQQVELESAEQPIQVGIPLSALDRIAMLEQNLDPDDLLHRQHYLLGILIENQQRYTSPAIKDSGSGERMTPAPIPVGQQVARRTFSTCEQAQQFAEHMQSGTLYNATVNGCTVDRTCRNGFDISHLADKYTEVLEVAA